MYFRYFNSAENGQLYESESTIPVSQIGMKIERKFVSLSIDHSTEWTETLAGLFYDAGMIAYEVNSIDEAKRDLYFLGPYLSLVTISQNISGDTYATDGDKLVPFIRTCAPQAKIVEISGGYPIPGVDLMIDKNEFSSAGTEAIINKILQLIGFMAAK